MSYNRLTKKDQDWFEFTEITDNEIYKRLQYLENKIENGTLVITNKPFVVLDYISNGQEYYAIRVAEEKDLAINLTQAEAEKKLKELQKDD